MVWLHLETLKINMCFIIFLVIKNYFAVESTVIYLLATLYVLIYEATSSKNPPCHMTRVTNLYIKIDKTK